MRILYYSPDYYWNLGARTYAREFFSALKKLPEVAHAEVFQQRAESTQAGKNNGRGKLSFLPPSWQRFIRYFAPRIELTRRIVDVAKSENIDCLLWSASDGKKLLFDHLGRHYSDLCICLDIQSCIFDEKFKKIPFRRFWQTLEVLRYRHAHCVIVVSSFLKEYLVERGMEAEKVLVRHNGVNTNIFQNKDSFDKTTLRTKYRIPSNAFVLGYVGGMEPWKRLPEGVKRFADLRRAGETDLYLLLAGNGEDMVRVQQAIQENDDVLNGWVSCLGWQPYEQIPEIMATFDVGFFPFTYPHCSPLKLFEHLAMGIPIIGPDTPAVREVFVDGEHLILVAKDGSNFNDAILRLKRSDELREDLARRGQAYVLKQFTWDLNAQKVFNHICKFSPKM